MMEIDWQVQGLLFTFAIDLCIFFLYLTVFLFCLRGSRGDEQRGLFKELQVVTTSQKQHQLEEPLVKSPSSLPLE